MLHIKEGYLLLECLFILLVCCTLLLLLPPQIEFNFELEAFKDAYYLRQAEALYLREEKDLANSYANISFYPNGNVNQARTINFKKQNLIITLGSGCLKDD